MGDNHDNTSPDRTDGYLGAYLAAGGVWQPQSTAYRPNTDPDVGPGGTGHACACAADFLGSMVLMQPQGQPSLRCTVRSVTGRKLRATLALRSEIAIHTDASENPSTHGALGGPAKGMPAWLVPNGGPLPDTEITSIIDYLKTLQGVSPVPMSTPMPENLRPRHFPPARRRLSPLSPQNPEGRDRRLPWSATLVREGCTSVGFVRSVTVRRASWGSPTRVPTMVVCRY